MLTEAYLASLPPRKRLALMASNGAPAAGGLKADSTPGVPMAFDALAPPARSPKRAADALRPLPPPVPLPPAPQEPLSKKARLVPKEASATAVAAAGLLKPEASLPVASHAVASHAAAAHLQAAKEKAVAAREAASSKARAAADALKARYSPPALPGLGVARPTRKTRNLGLRH